MSIVDRKMREKQEMRSRILESARLLFYENGFDNVSIRKIAEKIDYSPATIYLYFKHKDAILVELQKAGFRKLFREQQKNVREENPLVRLKLFLQTYLDFALKNREYYDLMFVLYSPTLQIRETSEWRFGKRSYEIYRDTVKQCQDGGYLTNSNLDTAAIGLWSIVHGIATLMIRHRLPMIRKQDMNSLAADTLKFIDVVLGVKK